ncbi:hypothetical protein Clacol_004473 [Clathrus columnatus]|uniref:Peptidase metallopeptidase domain-containing protein n=1 Tax=Clathrus columnatus TaxID=1419009 RepID=A0AAV5A6L0_9AGAM|nr:hypothetical protein Clacol_004473 [Clathrus columnatus]
MSGGYTCSIATREHPVDMPRDYDDDDSDNDSMCGTLDEPDLEAAPGQILRAVEAAGVGAYPGRGLKWKVGQTINVKFMGGTPDTHKTVALIVTTWEDRANISFNFSTKGDGDIRIAFDPKKGWSSYIGTRALRVPKDKPTMNLGYRQSTPTKSFVRHVLHEFGHALGLQHEHQSPASPILWDEEKVYREYASTNGWSRSTIRDNILKKVNSTNYSKFDPKSIMLYNVDKRLTKDGRGINHPGTLSETDEEFIRNMYPFPESSSESESGSNSDADSDSD